MEPRDGCRENLRCGPTRSLGAGFIEMMAAYVPEFAHVDVGQVCSWVLQLEAELAHQQTENLSSHDDSTFIDKISQKLQSLSEMLPSIQTKNTRSHSNSENSESSEGADAARRPSVEHDEYAENCRLLHEMFPNSCAMEIKNCVTIALGDVERAAATLMHRRENGQELTVNVLHSAARQPVCNDVELKSRIIDRYSYVETDLEVKEHKPLAPKVEPKKLVRYRDNKIVSLKGERYTEVPKAGADEENLKKPKKSHCP